MLKIEQWIKRLPIYGKFGKDVFWNIGSLGILGVSGIVLNILIAWVYGAAVLGVFNQVYAIYILFSQFAVGGIHLSVLRHISQFADNRQVCGKIIFSALLVTIITAGLTCFIVFIFCDLVGDVLHSPDVSLGLLYVLPGLWCFALNKILLAAMNGFRQMKVYALGMAFRYILMLVLLVICVFMRMPGKTLPLIFSGAEIILLVWLVFSVFRFCSFLRVSALWLKKHIVFGSKALLSGTLAEINTRVDVLMLGFFTGDVVVGIYSLAAVLAEGVIHLIVVIRTNVNPILSKLFSNNKMDELRAMIRQGIRMFYPIIGLFGICAMVVYPLFIYLFLVDSGFMASWPLFCILMTGIMLSAGYMPFNMLLIQTGRPGYHTIMICLTVAVNVILNGLLIPLFGMYGAALATSTSFVLGILLLKLFIRKTLRINI